LFQCSQTGPQVSGVTLVSPGAANSSCHPFFSIKLMTFSVIVL